MVWREMFFWTSCCSSAKNKETEIDRKHGNKMKRWSEACSDYPRQLDRETWRKGAERRERRRGRTISTPLFELSDVILLPLPESTLSFSILSTRRNTHETGGQISIPVSSSDESVGEVDESEGEEWTERKARRWRRKESEGKRTSFPSLEQSLQLFFLDEVEEG